MNHPVGHVDGFPAIETIKPLDHYFSLVQILKDRLTSFFWKPLDPQKRLMPGQSGVNLQFSQLHVTVKSIQGLRLQVLRSGRSRQKKQRSEQYDQRSSSHVGYSLRVMFVP